MVIICAQSGGILKKAGLQLLKGYLMFLTITLGFIFLHILTQDILKEIDGVFITTSLTLIFSERHLNL